MARLTKQEKEFKEILKKERKFDKPRARFYIMKAYNEIYNAY